MFNFLKKKTEKPEKPEKIDIISKTASLLIHAARIDENYTNNEKIKTEQELLTLCYKDYIILKKFYEF